MGPGHCWRSPAFLDGHLRWEASVVSDVLGIEARAIIAVHAPGLRRQAESARAGAEKRAPADRLVRRLGGEAATSGRPCVPGRYVS